MTYPSGMIRGNLAANPELRHTPSGKAVSEFTVLESQRTRNEAGTWVDAEPLAHRVVVWDALAENVVASLTRGDNVVFSGQVRPEAFTGRDGQARVSNKITVDALGADLRWNQVAVDRSARWARSVDPATPRPQASRPSTTSTSVDGVQDWPQVASAGPVPAGG